MLSVPTHRGTPSLLLPHTRSHKPCRECRTRLSLIPVWRKAAPGCCWSKARMSQPCSMHGVPRHRPRGRGCHTHGAPRHKPRGTECPVQCSLMGTNLSGGGTRWLRVIQGCLALCLDLVLAKLSCLSKPKMAFKRELLHPSAMSATLPLSLIPVPSSLQEQHSLPGPWRGPG